MQWEKRVAIRRASSGIALVLVLWMLALLTVIANELVFTSRTDLQIAGNANGTAQAEAIANAGVNKAMWELTRQQPNPTAWKPDGSVHEWDFQGHRLNITILDESAKIDINSGNDILLHGLFLANGLNDDEANALVDAIADWKDPDDLRRLHGAERDDYALVDKDYLPANASFNTIEELRDVSGMTSQLYRRIAGQITVYSKKDGVDSSIAPRETLLAIPGVTPEVVDAYLEQRRAAIALGQPAPVFLPGQALLASPTNNTFTIQVTVPFSGQSIYVRNAVVQRSNNPAVPFSVLAWRTSRRPADSPSFRTQDER